MERMSDPKNPELNLEAVAAKLRELTCKDCRHFAEGEDFCFSSVSEKKGDCSSEYFCSCFTLRNRLRDAEKESPVS